MLPFAKRLAPLKTSVLSLKFQACLARRVGQRLHAAMIKKAVAVKDDPADSLAETALGDRSEQIRDRFYSENFLRIFPEARAS